MSARRLRLEELRRMWEETRRLPPPPPSLDAQEAMERDLHGGRKPRDAVRLAALAAETAWQLLEVVEWGERRRLRWRGSWRRLEGFSRS